MLLQRIPEPYAHPFQGREGQIGIGGLGWPSESNAPCQAHIFAHSDNKVWTPGPLSYSQIKDNVTEIPAETCLTLANELGHALGREHTTNRHDTVVGPRVYLRPRRALRAVKRARGNLQLR